jgi:MraZ protein
MEQMFFGQYEHNLDAKGRMTIPANFREQTFDGVFVTEGFDHNLSVYSKQHFEAIAQNLAKTSLTNPASRELRRKIFSNSAELAYDPAGRILVPARLREMAGIKGSVVIVGIGDSFELWAVDAWKEQELRLSDPNADENRWQAFDLTTRGD